MTRAKLLRRLAAVAPSVLDHWTKDGVRGRCIMATAAAIDALDVFGLRAVPLSCRLVAVSRGWLAWDAGGRVGDPLAAGAYSVWIGDDEIAAAPGHFNGHLIAGIPSLGLALDLDLGQASRPAKGIALPRAAVFAWPADLDDASFELLDDAGGVSAAVAYRRTTDRGYAFSRDWREPERRRGNLRTELVEAVRHARDVDEDPRFKQEERVERRLTDRARAGI